MNRSASDIVPSVLLCLAAIGITYFATSNLKRPQAALVIGVVALVELLISDIPYIQELPRSQYIQPENPIIQAILKDSPDPLLRPRVLSMSRDPAISGNIFPAYGLQGASGFHDNELASSRAFREELFQIKSLDELKNNPYIDLNNIGYFVWDSQQGTQIIRTNTTSTGAVLYGAYEVVPADQINPTLAKGFNYHQVMLLADAPEGLPTEAKFTATTAPAQVDSTLPDSVKNVLAQVIASASQPRSVTGSVALVASPRMDIQTYSVETSAPALLFISGNYHPYWKAKVDGQDTKVLKAFGNFRAIVVPAGKHQVDFAYQSVAVAKSMNIVFGSIAILALLLAAFGWKLRKIAV